jgi:uncharacterized lipoprotein YmbA
VRRPAAIAILVALAGCGALFAPKRPTYEYYVLSAERSRTQAAPAWDRVEVAGRDRPAPIAVVGRVTFPEYLDREAIASRIDAHRLVYSSRDRWAEPLPEAFTRMFTQDLRAAVAASGITVQSGRIGILPDLDVRIDVLRFERTAADRVELWARWTVHADGRLVHSDESRLVERAAGPTSGPGAAALSRAIARLADEIGATVVTLSSRAARSDRRDRDPRPGTARGSSPGAPRRR